MSKHIRREQQGGSGCAQREMGLREWCAKLPDIHLVNRQLHQLVDTVNELCDTLEDQQAMPDDTVINKAKAMLKEL